MDYKASYGLSFQAYPSAYFNRKELSNPSANTMENYLKRQSGLTTDAMVKITSLTYSDDYTELKVSSNTRFGFDKSDVDYRLAYVITEDSVGPYMQINAAYSGSDTEMGGFEKLPSRTPVMYNDVARGICPSLTGIEGSVPATVSACTDYNYEYSFSMPKNCDDYSKLKLTILLYDAKTGEIVNADRIDCPQGKKTLEITVDTGNEPGTLKQKLGDQIYDIPSLTVKGKINGDDLATLASMMGSGSDYENLSYLDLSNARIVKGGKYLKYGEYSTLEEDDCLPEGVFANNSSLRYIAMPSSLKKIEDNALVNSYSIQEIKLNEGLEKIEVAAFAFYMILSCDGSRGSLKKINIPSTVSSLDPSFLFGCTKVDIVFDHRNKYYSYDNIALYSKDYNEFVMVSPSYNGIFTVNENCSFINRGFLSENISGLIATNLRKIAWSLPESENLAFMALGNPLESLGDYVFYGKTNLTDIYLGCNNIPSGNYRNSGIQFENASNCTLYVPSSSIEIFKADPFWGKMKDIKPIEGTEYEFLKSTGSNGIDNVLMDNKNTSKIYMIDGRSVNKMTKGMYIVNGKKIIMK